VEIRAVSAGMGGTSRRTVVPAEAATSRVGNVDADARRQQAIETLFGHAGGRLPKPAVQARSRPPWQHRMSGWGRC